MITILFLSAMPSDTPPLQLAQEARAVDQRLRGSELRDQMDLRPHGAVRAGDLQELLLRYRPAIVHFSGHGSQAGELYLEDANGQARPVPAPALQDLFAQFRQHVRCVVLNACFSQVQAQAIASQVDCVVGMSDEIPDTAAIAFSGAFYQALGYGRDVASAFALARNQVQMEHPGLEGIPQLLARLGDPSRVVLVGQDAGPSPQEAAPEQDHAESSSLRPVFPSSPDDSSPPGEPSVRRPDPAAARIFLSYARKDEAAVRQLHQALIRAGYRPWMDVEDILPGERWADAIGRAVKEADFFIACLSRNYVDRRGHVQRQQRQAMDLWQEQLDSDIYLIPARLEPCDIPERLAGFQGVDLFRDDGWPKLMKALEAGAARR